MAVDYQAVQRDADRICFWWEVDRIERDPNSGGDVAHLKRYMQLPQCPHGPEEIAYRTMKASEVPKAMGMEVFRPEMLVGMRVYGVNLPSPVK